MTQWPTQSHYPDTVLISPFPNIVMLSNGMYQLGKYWFDSAGMLTPNLPDRKPALWRFDYHVPSVAMMNVVWLERWQSGVSWQAHTVNCLMALRAVRTVSSRHMAGLGLNTPPKYTRHSTFVELSQRLRHKAGALNWVHSSIPVTLVTSHKQC